MEQRIGSLIIDRAQKPTPVPEHDPWAGVFNPKEVPMAEKRPEIKMKALKDFMGENGGLLKKDSPYTLYSENVALQHVQKQLGERLSPEPSPESEEAESAESEDEAKPWLMQMEPDAYLEKYGPDAKNSAQARAEIARRGGSISGTGSSG